MLKGEGAMDTQMKELIAIGASVTANCMPCLRYHLHEARQAGADDHQIQTAVKVGRKVRKDAGAKWDEEADALLSLESTMEEAQKSAQESGNCEYP
jgi:AhpD family alkylhydroperoxidase